MKLRSRRGKSFLLTILEGGSKEEAERPAAVKQTINAATINIRIIFFSLAGSKKQKKIQDGEFSTVLYHFSEREY
jgi:hypothetical protein